jgi:PAS domain S-box-containing protein
VFDWPAQKVIYASPAYEEIWGRSMRSLYDRYEEWGESVHPDDRAFAETSFAEVVETNGGGLREYRIVRPDGTVRWVSDRAYPVRDSEGQICRVVGIAEDITDRKETEEALRESQVRMQTAIENLPFGFFLIGEDGRYAMQNSACRENWGDLIGKRPEDLAPDDRTLALWQENNRRAFAGEVVRGEVALAPQGRKGTYYNIIAPVRDGGKVRGVLGVNIDVTAREEAKEALRESEQKLRTVAEQSPNMIFINQAGRIVYVNRRCEELMGYTKEEFCGPDFDFLGLIVPEHRERTMANFRRHMAGEEVPEMEYAILTKRGERIEAILATKLIRYEGHPAILGTVADITRHKLAEEALRKINDELEGRVKERTAALEAEIENRRRTEAKLRESEAQYRTLVESAVDAIATVRDDGVILFVNGTVASQFGVTPEAMVGKRMGDFFPKAFAEVQLERIREVIRSGEGTNITSPALVGGQQRWFNTTFEPLDLGEARAALIIARDINDLVRAQRQLEDTREQMRRADRLASLGTMSAMVAHELTQPLTVVRLSIQNALAAIKTEAPAGVVAGDLEGTMDEIATMTEIIERFRGFARASSPGHERDVSLSEIAAHVVGLTAEAADRARVSVSASGLEGLPRFSARPKDMEQMFFALIMNAIQAADGQVDRTVTVTAEAGDGEIELRFGDNCGGIVESDIDHIFRPFFTTKGQAGGTGLGLCVVEHILGRYQGKIQPLNRPGEGVTFQVTLPLPACS